MVIYTINLIAIVVLKYFVSGEYGKPLKLRLEEEKNKSGSTKTKKMDAGSSSENPNPDWEYSSEWDEETSARLEREFPQVTELIAVLYFLVIWVWKCKDPMNNNKDCRVGQ